MDLFCTRVELGMLFGESVLLENWPRAYPYEEIGGHIQQAENEVQYSRNSLDVVTDFYDVKSLCLSDMDHGTSTDQANFRGIPPTTAEQLAHLLSIRPYCKTHSISQSHLPVTPRTGHDTSFHVDNWSSTF